MSTVDETSPGEPASIERIHRLERLERERLEDKARRDERRRQRIAEAKPAEARDLVYEIERVTRYPMLVLGFAWLVVVIVVLAGGNSGSGSTALVGTLFALWVVLLVEYVVRLVVAPDRRSYLKQRWVEPATVVVPPLQGWHLIGVEKVCLVVQEAALQVQAVLRHHSLFRVLIAAFFTLVLGAWLVLLFEQDAKGSNIHNYGSALWWAIVTVTTVGYGDRFPVTGGGRGVAVVLMLLGIGLIGVLTATVASVFVKQHTDANKEAIQKGHANLFAQLSVISDRLGDVERRLGATPEQVAAIDVRADAEAASEGAPDDGGGSTS